MTLTFTFGQCFCYKKLPNLPNGFQVSTDFETCEEIVALELDCDKHYVTELATS